MSVKQLTSEVRLLKKLQALSKPVPAELNEFMAFVKKYCLNEFSDLIVLEVYKSLCCSENTFTSRNSSYGLNNKLYPEPVVISDDDEDKDNNLCIVLSSDEEKSSSPADKKMNESTYGFARSKVGNIETCDNSSDLRFCKGKKSKNSERIKKCELLAHHNNNNENQVLLTESEDILTSGKSASKLFENAYKNDKTSKSNEQTEKIVKLKKKKRLSTISTLSDSKKIYIPDETKKEKTNIPDETKKEKTNIPDETKKEKTNIPDETKKEKTNIPDETKKEKTNDKNSCRKYKKMSLEEADRLRNILLLDKLIEMNYSC